MFDKYLENVDAYVNWGKFKNGQDPNEEFMRSIEEKANVSHQAKKWFREDIMINLSRHIRKGWRFTWESEPRIKAALLAVLEVNEQ